VGAKRIAAQEEMRLTSSPCVSDVSVIRVISSFCRWATSVECTVSAFWSSVRNVAMRSTTRITWSCTSRRFRVSSASISYFSEPRRSPSIMASRGCAARWNSMTSRWSS
jgi:hypothetical protein